MGFPKASALMYHIENNECDVIKQEDFQRQRAEKQIEKDAWTDVMDPTGGSFLPSNVGSNPGSNEDSVNLVDARDMPNLARDWQGKIIETQAPAPLQPARPGGYRAPAVPVEGMASLTLQKFPALPLNKPESQIPQSDNGELLDLTQPEIRLQKKAPTAGSWANSNSAATSLFTVKQQAQGPSSSTLSGWNEDNNSTVTAATYSGQSRMFPPSTTSNPWGPPSTVSPLSEQSGNGNTSRIQTIARIAPPTSLEVSKYFNHILEKYICRGMKCARKFDTPKQFVDHLLTGAHVAGQVACPFCHKKFKTTTALMAHCESGSRKCDIRNSMQYNEVIREITGGIVATDGYMYDGTVKYQTPSIENW